MKDLLVKEHVVSFEIAEKLKECGFPQDYTLMHWIVDDKKYPAPNASELIHLMPKYDEKLGHLIIYWDQGRLLWVVGYKNSDGIINYIGESVKLENALALCWININIDKKS
ncbi:MAG TPA: hypothetical protein ENG63_03095 [Candidatus Desulfofervidus auxilii]|uniref:Uncharacterized protein n=1 Tax=Desulfofervidus auxilii TaxID=1621989 RepID=A0A7C0U2A2_DESA2|nr:hypothetical protein [Candidatus Desulfofervidus auxilii]